MCTFHLVAIEFTLLHDGTHVSIAVRSAKNEETNDKSAGRLRLQQELVAQRAVAAVNGIARAVHVDACLHRPLAIESREATRLKEELRYVLVCAIGAQLQVYTHVHTLINKLLLALKHNFHYKSYNMVALIFLVFVFVLISAE